MKSARLSPTAKLLAALATLPFFAATTQAQFVLTGSDYTQNFDSIGSGLPANWDVRTGASATALGTAATAPSTAIDWANSGGAFKNFASATGLASADIAATQAASTDRALGIRQTGAFGDPGAAFNFNFNASGKTFSALSIDLEMLSVQTRSTTWSLQYGVGASPASFTTLDTFTDPGVFGTTVRTYTASQLIGMNNQANVWFRVVATSATTGSGSRDSFAIDNFSLSFAASGADVSIGGGSVFTASSFGGAAFTAGDIAVFNGTAGTVDLSGAVVAAGLKFDTTGYTLASPTGADTITITGGVEVAGTATATISGKVTGSNALTKTGTGTLVLTNTGNDFVGNVSVNAGTLEVASDAVLGNAANDLNLGGGTFKPTSSFTLGAGRDISGAGSIAVASGNTLTVSGNLNNATLNLSDTGTVALNGAANTASGLSFSAAGALTGEKITLLGNLSTTAYTGTATIGNALELGGTTRTFTVLGDVTVNGAVSTTATNAYLTKNGTGTLTLNGDTTGPGGVQLGTQGTSPIDGGKLVIGTAANLGASQVRFNSGELVIGGTSPRTFANSLSIGGRLGSSVSVPTISGANATFTGTGATVGTANGFFKNNGLTTAMAFNVNNVTTVTGDWINNAGTAAGVTLGGTGTFVIEGNASAITETWTLADSVSFLLKNTLGGGVVVTSGTTFGGGGTITGAEGLVADRGATLKFNLDGTSVDTITTTTFGLGTGGSGNIAFDFSGTGSAGTFDIVSFTALAGGFVAGDVSLFTATNFAAGFSGTFALLADKLQITVVSGAIPEPSSVAGLAGLAALGAVGLRRRRRAAA